MHILFIVDPIDKQKAGIYHYTLQMVYHIWKMNTKHQLSFISLNSDQILSQIKAIPLPNTIPFIMNDPIRQLVSLPHLINKIKPDVVVEPAHFGPFNLLKRIKRITVIHDLTPILFPDLHPLSSQVLHRIFMKRILRKADLIITNSENTKLDVIKYSKQVALKTHSVLLGKDKLFRPLKDESILEKHRIGKPFILSVGTLEPRKNLITLLNAFRIFKSTHQSDVVLVMTGQNGWKNKNLEKTINEHPFKQDIIRTAYVDSKDLPALYSHCSVFIYPSLYEGFGLPLLEAMACGAPCIAAQNSSLTEVGGNAAVYFETKNAEDLSSKIKKVIEDDKWRKELENKSLEQAEGFSWEKYATEFIGLIEQKWGIK